MIDQSVLLAIGFLASAVAAVLLARRADLPLRRVTLGLSACFVGAVVGSKLLGGLIRPDLWLEDPAILLDLRRTGATSFGALLGGCFGFYLYTWRARQDVFVYADALVPAAGVGLFFARLGCFVHGCDYGRMTELPWGIRYPADSMAWNAHLREGFIGEHQLSSLPVHPFQVTLALLTLGIFTLFLFSPGLGRRHGIGRRAVLAGALYFSGRFVLEFLRSPWSSPVVGFFNVAQWLALFSLVVLFALKRWLDVHRPLVAGSDGFVAESAGGG